MFFQHNRSYFAFCCCWRISLRERGGIIHQTAFHKSIWPPWKYGRGDIRGSDAAAGVAVTVNITLFAWTCLTQPFFRYHIESLVCTLCIKSIWIKMSMQSFDHDKYFLPFPCFIVITIHNTICCEMLRCLLWYFILITINKLHKTVAANKS